MILVAEIVVIVILALFTIIHSAVLLKLIPYKIVWGNRLKNEKQMYRFEAVSLIMILLFLWIALQNSNLILVLLPTQIINTFYWMMTFLFALNTLGNLSSKSRIEKFIFAPITLILTMACLIIAIG